MPEHICDHLSHSVMQSFEPGETWGWCYEHERYLGPFESVR